MGRDEVKEHGFEISQEGFEGLRIGWQRFAQPGRGGRDPPELGECIKVAIGQLFPTDRPASCMC